MGIGLWLVLLIVNAVIGGYLQMRWSCNRLRNTDKTA